jgi:hypothetical protein
MLRGFYKSSFPFFKINFFDNYNNLIIINNNIQPNFKLYSNNNNIDINNDNKNNNDNNNNEEKKQNFFDNVKEGFFNIGQSIKNLYKKDE